MNLFDIGRFCFLASQLSFSGAARDSVMAAMDLNGDGKITKTEWLFFVSLAFLASKRQRNWILCFVLKLWDRVCCFDMFWWNRLLSVSECGLNMSRLMRMWRMVSWIFFHGIDIILACERAKSCGRANLFCELICSVKHSAIGLLSLSEITNILKTSPFLSRKWMFHRQPVSVLTLLSLLIESRLGLQEMIDILLESAWDSLFVSSDLLPLLALGLSEHLTLKNHCELEQALALSFNGPKRFNAVKTDFFVHLLSHTCTSSLPLFLLVTHSGDFLPVVWCVAFRLIACISLIV